MTTSPRLKPFAYVVLILVGEAGAGPHDIVRMMRVGHWYWAGSDSQLYAEPKRLEKLGYLTSRREAGVTKERTVYELTESGREALREWLRSPASRPRIQDEPAVRLLANEFVEPAETLESLRPLRAQLEADLEMTAEAEKRAEAIPHREAVLKLNHRLARRMIEAHLAWLDEVEEELG